MNYLIQAFACSPSQGGEYAVSWGWVKHLSNSIGFCDAVYVLSLTLTEQDIKNSNLYNVHLLQIDDMNKYAFLNYNIIYQRIWQKKAYETVKNANIKFDFIHIYSLSDFRMPGQWYKLSDAFKVFGPVGGGQTSPKCVKEYDTGGGSIRAFINFVYKCNPFYRNKVKRYDRVYACNKETQSYLPNSKVLIDVPLRDDFRNLDIIRACQEIPTILFAGRLIVKKGIMVLLDALKLIDNSLEYVVLIYGDGEQKKRVEQRIVELDLQCRVKIMGKLPYNDMSKVYRNAEIFVMPSLRESGGSVMIEAMAHKLPIVALDMSVAHILNENNCGLFVDVNQSKDEMLQQFAANLTRLIKDSEVRRVYGENGYRFVNKELNWSSMIDEVYGDFIRS